MVLYIRTRIIPVRILVLVHGTAKYRTPLGACHDPCEGLFTDDGTTATEIADSTLGSVTTRPKTPALRTMHASTHSCASKGHLSGGAPCYDFVAGGVEGVHARPLAGLAP